MEDIGKRDNARFLWKWACVEIAKRGQQSGENEKSHERNIENAENKFDHKLSRLNNF